MVKSFPVKPDLNNTAIHYISVLSIQGFPVAQMVENLPAMQEAQVQSLGREDPLEKEWQPTPDPMDRGAWWATVHGVTVSACARKHKHTLSLGLLFLWPVLHGIWNPSS